VPPEKSRINTIVAADDYDDNHDDGWWCNLCKFQYVHLCNRMNNTQRVGEDVEVR
jgi:hypothetical protein